MIISNQDMDKRIDELHGIPTAPQYICTRCGGLLVKELSIDLWRCTSELECGARRCVQCGDVIDVVILRNRRTRLILGSLPSTERPISSTEPQVRA